MPHVEHRTLAGAVEHLCLKKISIDQKRRLNSGEVSKASWVQMERGAHYQGHTSAGSCMEKQPLCKYAQVPHFFSEAEPVLAVVLCRCVDGLLTP